MDTDAGRSLRYTNPTAGPPDKSLPTYCMLTLPYLIGIVSRVLSTIFFHVVLSFIAVFSSPVFSPVSSHSCLHRFFWVVQFLLFHGSVSTTKYLLRFLPHFDNNSLRNVFFVYVLYLLVVEFFRKGESSLDDLSMIYLI